ncbi:endonuclease SmrB [Thalassotalea euphylliae]|uniref:Ribosome rescue factor SmrB n=1 Tax=Thalassotalea euphylliae TaxID=1655234 RepID=A0A3E0UKC3_9GAMM|nr:endonuclease SmrB [Thalassotalea euphylliae]REL37316.1 endonuclease SmrB [Thalassotalea euphylliae]
MKFKDLLTAEEKQLFKDEIGKVKRLKQDKVVHQKKRPTSAVVKANQMTTRQVAEFHFSDEFEPDLNRTGPMQYVKEGTDSYEAKNLRRGIYHPELILDLHGLTQEHAKREIASLLLACHKEHARCVCIVHGIGNRILKNKVPHWLVQHPDVLAFHQAPLEYGGDGALLALVDIKDKY